MGKLLSIITLSTSGIITFIISLFASLGTEIKIIISLLVWLLVALGYALANYINLCKVRKDLNMKEQNLESSAKKISDLQGELKIETTNRKYIGRLYTNVDREYNNLLNQLRTFPDAFYSIFIYLNTYKTRKTSEHIKAINAKRYELQQLIDKEWEHGRKRNIPGDQDY